MRNLEKQPQVIALDKGMDQSRSDRASPPGTLSVVENCRIRSGELRKRCGSSAIASTDSGFISERTLGDSTTRARPVEHPAFIGKVGDQKIAAATSGWVFAYRGTLWRYLASYSAAQPVRKRLGIPPTQPTQPVGPYVPAVAVTASGYICTASGFGPELKITVESPTGELLLATTETVGAASIVVRVIAVSTTSFMVFYQGTGSTTVSRKTVAAADSTAAGATTGTSLVTLANASSTWDVSYYDGTTWFLVYQSGATTVTISERNSAATQVTSQTFTSTSNLTYLSIWADNVTDRVWVGVVDDPTGTPTSQFRVYTDALVLSFGPTSFATSGSVPLFGPLYKRTPVAGDAFFVYWSSLTNPTRTTLRAGAIEAGSLTRETSQGGNVVPVSKPDAQQRVWCMTHGSGANFQTLKAVLLRCVGTEFITESSFDPTPVVELASADMEATGATYHPFAAPGLAFNSVAVTTEAAGGKAYFALPFVLTSRTNASGNAEPTTRVDVYEYTRWNQEPHRQMVATGRAGYIAGQPTECWGRLAVISDVDPVHGGAEVGMTQAPVLQTPTTTPDANGVAAGSRLYYAVKQWVDDEGVRHLSAPSPPMASVLTEPSSVEIRVPNVLVGQRSNVHNPVGSRYPDTLLYRTLNGGTEAHQVPIVGADAGGSFITFTDTVSDAIIGNNEFLYTGGGVLPNVLAPSCRYIAASEERLWCGGLWDSNIVECSKIRVPGEPYNFTGHPSHQVVIPGEVSGLAYMDGQVCVFTEDAIYIVSGDGPNDQGAGGFAPPRALIRGVGCPRAQSASILETEQGILFRSTLGFYLIPRGFGTPVYIGEKVQDENPVVLSSAATTTSEHRLARFLVCASGATKSDTTLALDLTSLQWLRDTYSVDGAVITGQGFSEIGEWPDGLALFSYGLQRTDNLKIVWAEDEDLTGDAGAAGVGVSTFIGITVQTAWQYAEWGPAGWGRANSVILAFVPTGACSLSLAVETDDNSTQTGTWTVAVSAEGNYRGIAIEKPTCSAYRLTITDVASSGDSAGCRLQWLAVDAVPQGGMRPLLNSAERQ